MLQRSGTTNRVGRTVVRSATSAVALRARNRRRVDHGDVAIIARPFFHRQNAMSREEGPHGKLWGGRFSEPTDQFVERFTASIGFDARLYHCDIAGSIAHAKMLASVGVITPQARDRIVTGLEAIRSQADRGELEWSSSVEDVHMNVESRLIALVGDVGKKLHTARSRNDQIATDIRLYLREGIDGISDAMTDLMRAIV